MRIDVDDDLEVLAGWLADRDVDSVTSAFRDGVLWALARMSGRDRDGLAADLQQRLEGTPSTIVGPPLRRPTPVADAIPTVSGDELIARATGRGESFGPPMLGLTVTRRPQRRVYDPANPPQPAPSFSAAASTHAADHPDDPLVQAIPAEELAAIEAARTSDTGQT